MVHIDTPTIVKMPHLLSNMCGGHEIFLNTARVHILKQLKFVHHEILIL